MLPRNLLKLTANSIGPVKNWETLIFMKFYDFKKLIGPCKKTTKRITFVVLFQGQVYPREHLKQIPAHFGWFSLNNWETSIFLKIYDFQKLIGPCKKTTKRITFVVLFQGQVYPWEHLKHIRGAFRWFFAEQLRNFAFYKNLRFQKTFEPL